MPQLDGIVFTRRDDIDVWEKRVDVFSSEQPGGLMTRLMGENMMRRDGVPHQTQRRQIQPSVSPRTVARHWREAFRDAARTILQGLSVQRSADLCTDYAMLLSGEALRLITGLEAVSARDMDAHSQAMIDGIANYGGDPDTEARCLSAVAALDAAINARIADFETTPTDVDTLAGSSMIAVLVRAGFQTREFEERFLAIGLPYRVVGARFYERAEIRDAMAYLRIVNQPADDLACERIITTPKRGLGAASLQTIYAYARSTEQPLLGAAGVLADSDELKPQARRALKQFCSSIAGWYQQRDQMPPADLARMILDESGYTGMWQKDKAPDAPGRLENLKELITALEDFDTLGGFLEHISLVMDNATPNPEGEVTLMTLHAAKGLEYETVFLPGWEEGIFPSQRTLDETGGAGLEEERRLAYVGLTRARRNVHISFAANRRVHGLWQSSIPSRFVSELPKDHIKEDFTQGIGMGGAIGRAEPAMSGSATTRIGKPGYGPGWQRMASRSLGSPSAPQRDKDGWLQGTGKKTDFQKDERVFHQKFGMGSVVSTDADKLEIMFDKAGVKKVVASFIKRASEV